MTSKALLPSSNGANALGPPRLSSVSSLVRQGSIYSMTLDEFQNVMNDPGKNLGSMNMEDFLKNIWTAEESQAMAAALPPNLADSSNNAAPAPAISRQPSLQRHGSLSLPPDLTNKTVDEVWKEIDWSSDPNPESKIQHRQPTLGEMTLEDFLAKAGIVRDENEAGALLSASNSMLAYAAAAAPGGHVGKVPLQVLQDMPSAPQPGDWISFPAVLQQQQQQMLQQQHLLQQQQQAEAVAPYTGRLISPSSNILDTSFNGAAVQGPGMLSLSPATLAPDTPNRGKKRMFEGVEEKAAEQRQRRMIKNRESAARSRARKQAYTVELEAEVTQLKEENARLKQVQDEETEKRRNQIMETLIPVTEKPRQVRMLRRTWTTSW